MPERRIATLGSLVKFVGGGTPSKSRPDFFTGNIPWVSPKDMKSSEIWDSSDRITTEAIKSSATRLIPANSVLVVVRSGVLKHRLPIAINRVPVTINQDLKALICNGDLVPEYLRYWLSAHTNQILQSVRGTTADNIPVELLKSIEIPLPPLPEQRRIAAILDQADALRAKRREAIAKLESLTQAIFYQMIGNPITNPNGYPAGNITPVLS